MDCAFSLATGACRTDPVSAPGMAITPLSVKGGSTLSVPGSLALEMSLGISIV